MRAAAEQALEPTPAPSPAQSGPVGARAPEPLSAAGLLALQRSAGNAAVGRVLGTARGRPLQRDCGGDCGCAKCTATKATPVKSVRKGDHCDPSRTISGVVFVPARDEEIEVANKAVQGSKSALAKQGIALDLQVKPYLELGDLSIEDDKGMRSVSSYATVCALLHQLEPMRSKNGVVVLVVPISGEVCEGHGAACYVPHLDAKCGGITNVNKVIIVGRFISSDDLDQVLAHELGHHAGQPQRKDPATYGHEPYDKGNFMNFGKDRDHYRAELLDRMCTVSFQF